MAKFLGGDGQEWEIRFTTRILRRMSRDAGLDIIEMSLCTRPDGSTDLDRLSSVLRYDRLVEALWVLCDEQAQARRVTKDQFMDNVMVPYVLPSIMEAFMLARDEAMTPPVREGDAVANPPAEAVANPAPGVGPTS